MGSHVQTVTHADDRLLLKQWIQALDIERPIFKKDFGGYIVGMGRFVDDFKVAGHELVLSQAWAEIFECFEFAESAGLRTMCNAKLRVAPKITHQSMQCNILSSGFVVLAQAVRVRPNIDTCAARGSYCVSGGK